MHVTYKTSQQTYTPVSKLEDGKEFISVPVVMMVEGVHNGSAGAVYHSKEELEKTVPFWAGKPVTINHPEMDGVYVSASNPEIAAEWVVGEVETAYMEENKLKGIIRIDTQRLLALSTKALEQIRNANVMEVSVGLFASGDMNESGEWNGEIYTKIAVNCVPDHIALLPEDVGACSVKDGCGLRVNNDVTKKGEGNEMDWLKPSDVQKQEFIANIGEGFRETVNLIYDALDTMYSETTWYSLEEAYPGYAIITKRVREKTLSGYSTPVTEMYKQEYEVSNGKLKWTGEPTKVTKKVEYLQVNTEKKMCEKCKEKAVLLIGYAGNSLVEADIDWLAELTEDKLDKFIPVAVNKEPITVEAAWGVIQANVKSLDEYLPQLPEVVQAEIKLGLKVYAENKKTVVDSIIANTEKGIWEEETLNGMPLEVLQKIEKSVSKENTNFDYSIQGVRMNVNKGGTSDVAPMHVN